MAEVILSAQNLRKTYQMGEVEVQALKDATLDLMTGEFVVLLGHSGSGKSTLLNIMGALDSPTSGQLRFRDRDLTASFTERRCDHANTRKLQRRPQNTMSRDLDGICPDAKRVGKITSQFLREIDRTAKAP